MSYDHRGDLCLSFWADIWNTGILTFPPGAKVLEIGCAEADWMTSMLKERPDLQITGIDWRECSRPGTVVRDDVMVHDFPPEFFDAIVSVSAIEHIGLGSYNNDPHERFGDTKTIQRAYTWLKPGGWMYLDVPYRPNGPYSVNSNFRAYDEEHLQSRLMVGGFREVFRKVVGEPRGDGPYIALVLQK